MTVFWSWQSQLEAVRDRLTSALKSAVDELELDLDEANRDLSGSAAIAHEVQRKIAEAEVAVFDISYVASDEQRRYPNSNVLIELGMGLYLPRFGAT